MSSVTSEPVQIPLTNGGFTLVDAEDADWVRQWSWHHIEGYVRRKTRDAERRAGAPKNIQLHRALLAPPDEVHVHHWNEDALDNRKANLDVMSNSLHQREHVCRLREQGVDKFGGYRPNVTGEQNGQAKLTERQVRAIKALLVFGWATQAEIVRMVGVSKSAISRIAIGKSWSHV